MWCSATVSVEGGGMEVRELDERSGLVWAVSVWDTLSVLEIWDTLSAWAVCDILSECEGLCGGGGGGGGNI